MQACLNKYNKVAVRKKWRLTGVQIVVVLSALSQSSCIILVNVCSLHWMLWRCNGQTLTLRIYWYCRHDSRCLCSTLCIIGLCICWSWGKPIARFIIFLWLYLIFYKITLYSSKSEHMVLFHSQESSNFTILTCIKVDVTKASSLLRQCLFGCSLQYDLTLAFRLCNELYQRNL